MNAMPQKRPGGASGLCPGRESTTTHYIAER